MDFGEVGHPFRAPSIFVIFVFSGVARSPEALCKLACQVMDYRDHYGNNLKLLSAISPGQVQCM